MADTNSGVYTTSFSKEKYAFSSRLRRLGREAYRYFKSSARVIICRVKALHRKILFFSALIHQLSALFLHSVCSCFRYVTHCPISHWQLKSCRRLNFAAVGRVELRALVNPNSLHLCFFL